MGRRRRLCGRHSQPVELRLAARPALAQAGHLGRDPSGLLGQLTAPPLKTRMLLLGRRRRRPPLGFERLVGLEGRGQFGHPGALDLEIALGQVPGRIRPGKLVDQLLAPEPQLAGLLATGGIGAAGLVLRLACRGGGGRRGGGFGRCLIGGPGGRGHRDREFVELDLGAVTLGAGAEPRRLTRVGGPPQLTAIGVDALAVDGDGQPRTHLGKVIDEPHITDQPARPPDR